MALEPRKVSASAGASWLLGALGLYARAPLALGLLGLIYGAILAVVAVSAQVNLGLFVLLELGLLVLGPVLTGGLILAAREVDQNRRPQPGRLLAGLHEGRFPRLLATLLPQIAAAIVMVVLFVLVIGLDGMKAFVAVGQAAQAGGQPDPALLAALPWARLLLWIVLMIVVALAVGFYTMLAVPEIMQRQTPAFTAMAASFRACLRNLPAIIVFFILTLIAVLALQFAVLLVGVAVKLVLGAKAMEFITQLVTMVLLMPTLSAAIYLAWKDMLGETAPPPLPAAGGFEA
jgi:uncharacterized membrane protein